MPVIHEGDLADDREIVWGYRGWPIRQVQEMLAMPGFTGARIVKSCRSKRPG
jgi:hypothetical protein